MQFERKIKNNPNVLHGNQNDMNLTLLDVINLYLTETEGIYSQTKINVW
ncbi:MULTISPECIES: hypothetical protein [unclassified Acinetobacter]|nr:MULTISPECIES: hypothetical protein [unclassified Acinetobacter]WOE32257.1 hypothetical protein QSG84_03315 [Acinetobacter sp. SAAs470]WOE37727.1 hypothetical protein QSG86_12360 [Acinetobacter sp. SAAs474]